MPWVKSKAHHSEGRTRQGAKEALLVAWCIDTEGRKHLLHLAVGNKESEAAWTEFFRNMVARGLRMPTSVTTDGAPGMINAVKVVFDRSIRIRCWFHRLANIRSKLPDDDAPEVMAYLYAVRDAPTIDAARAAADRFESLFEQRFPSAIACFRDDRDALLPSTGSRSVTASECGPPTWLSAASRRSAGGPR